MHENILAAIAALKVVMSVSSSIGITCFQSSNIAVLYLFRGQTNEF